MGCETMWDKVIELAQQAPRPSAGQDILLFGGGLCGTLTIPLLRNELKLIAVCDNDKRKQGTLIEGLPCVSPDALAQYQNPFVLVSSSKNYQSIHEELLDRNIPHCNLESYVVNQKLNAFHEVYQALDKESRRVYAGVLYCRLLGTTFGVEQYCTDDQYFCFPEFRYIGLNDTYIDCGAFTGDIVQKVVENSMGVFHRIYAFEPNGKTYTAMKKRAEFLKDIWALEDGQIVLEQKGVGGARAFASMQENFTNQANTYITSNDNGQGDIEIVALDEYLARRGAEKITFIKADIEGFEWDMLHGAARTIQRDKPNLAISIYHSIFDFFRIYQYLKQLVPEYTFAVRHHWNSLDETILYCYVR